MGKVTVVFLTLVMLGVWGWMAWGEYADFVEWNNALNQPKFENEPASIPRGSTDAVGFAKYMTGLEEHGILRREMDAETANAQTNVRIALGAIVALSATMIFAVTGGSGAIFSVMVTAFIAFFAAAANMVFALSLLVRTGWAVFGTADPVEYQFTMYGIALYGLLTVVTAFTAMRQSPVLVRGKRSAMHAVMKCLLILLIASAGLAPLGVPEDFVVYGYHGAYWLAGLCLLSLLFIGLTHSNYEYD